MISIVICSINPARFERVSHEYSRVLEGEQFEIVGIHDAVSLAEGYNRGVARSRGELLIFSHDDIEILSPDFKDRVVGHLNKYDLVGVAGTMRLCDARWNSAGPPYVYGQIAQSNPEQKCIDVFIWGVPSRAVSGIQAMDGVFLAARRQVAESIRFDEESFGGFHLYDLDFTFRSYLANYRLAVCGDIQLLHSSLGDFFGAAWKHSAEIFMRKHRGRLMPMPQRNSRCACVVRVTATDELLEIMTPPHWNQ